MELSEERKKEVEVEVKKNFSESVQQQEIRKLILSDLCKAWQTEHLKHDYFKGLKDSTMDGIANWLVYGRHPGGFLECVLRNDLFGAILSADKENNMQLGVTVKFIYEFLPGNCYGKYFDDWMKMGGYSGCFGDGKIVSPPPPSPKKS